MTLAWRIDKAARLKMDAFSGEGARLYPGRWNISGNRMVYTAQSLSLAALEKFVHMGSDGMKVKFAAYKIEIPDHVKAIRWEIADLPANWRTQPTPISTQTRGDEWIRSNSSAVLIVPSVVTPEESNILLNPAHAEFGAIKISDAEPFSFDPRMWK